MHQYDESSERVYNLCSKASICRALENLCDLRFKEWIDLYALCCVIDGNLFSYYQIYINIANSVIFLIPMEEFVLCSAPLI